MRNGGIREEFIQQGHIKCLLINHRIGKAAPSTEVRGTGACVQLATLRSSGVECKVALGKPRTGS